MPTGATFMPVDRCLAAATQAAQPPTVATPTAHYYAAGPAALQAPSNDYSNTAVTFKFEEKSTTIKFGNNFFKFCDIVTDS